MTSEPTCLIRVSHQLLTSLLGINKGGHIDAAFMDNTDIAEDSISFRIRGLGHVTAQGGQHRYVPMDGVTHDPREGA